MTHNTLTDRQQYAAMVPEVLELLAEPHVSAEGSRLRKLEANIEEHPAQDPFCFRFQGDRQDIAVIDTVAAAAEPRFAGMMDGLRQDEEALAAVNEAGNLLKEGNNVWVISPHGDILDIAYVTKFAFNLLDQQDYTPRRVICVLSKMLARVGFELIPDQPPISTVGTMGMQCDDVFLTWPRTKSAKAVIDKLPRSEVDRNNEQAAEAMDAEFGQGGVLAAMAPTGTTRMATDRHGALVIPTPSRGTLDLMMKPNTYVLPVPAWFKGEEGVVSMPTGPLEISDEVKAHAMFTFMAEVMTEKIDGHDFTYKAPKASRRLLGQAALGSHRRPQL